MFLHSSTYIWVNIPYPCKYETFATVQLMKNRTKSLTETDGRWFLWKEMKKIVNFTSFRLCKTHLTIINDVVQSTKMRIKIRWKIADNEFFFYMSRFLRIYQKKEDDVIKLIWKLLRLRPKIAHFLHITLNLPLLDERKFY